MIHSAAKILRYLLGTILLLGVALNCLNTLMRLVWGSNIVWAEEVMTFGMIFIIMMGTVIVTAGDQQLRMDAFVQCLPQRWQIALSTFSHAVLSAVCAYLCLQSWTVISMMFRMGQTSIAARMPMWIPHSVFVVSFALCAAIGLVLTFQSAQKLLHSKPAHSK